ncbi:hypothetical protein [Klebsiella variicola]|uniref:hypothetical protein n=1 Tax=Klebsiella variicola TaxID=244366 RepID=UPI002B06133E|nr:hypothetical protein [Klebsiella variicola]
MEPFNCFSKPCGTFAIHVKNSKRMKFKDIEVTGSLYGFKLERSCYNKVENYKFEVNAERGIPRGYIHGDSAEVILTKEKEISYFIRCAFFYQN